MTIKGIKFQAIFLDEETKQDFQCELYSSSIKSEKVLIQKGVHKLIDSLVEDEDEDEKIEIAKELLEHLADKLLPETDSNEYTATTDQRKSLLIGLINSL